MKWESRSLVLAALGILLAATTATAALPSTELATKPLQFTSGGHIVGFTSKDVVVATGSHALRVEFIGAQGVEPVAAEATVSDSKAATLTRVTYPGVWQGITLVYDAPSGLLRSTYTVAPGADPATIRLRYNVPVSVETGGGLKIAFATGTMHESAPLAWQDIEGRRITVTVAFTKISEAEVGFQLGLYDKARPLTIDPTLTWSTFLGGIGAQEGDAITTDGNGYIFVTGFSAITWGTPIRAFSGHDAFVAKLNPNGTVVWNTFLGGTDWESGHGIVVHPNGTIYVSGESAATWGSPIRAHSGGGKDAFVARLNPNGILVWNTFLGGTDWDDGFGIATDVGANVYVTGTSLAAWGVPSRAFSAFGFDAFVAKLDQNGALLQNTFLGGPHGQSWGYGVAANAAGGIYVTGVSGSTWEEQPVHPRSGGGVGNIRGQAR